MVLAAGRSLRPHDFAVSPTPAVAVARCPFCAGNEHQTPPTIAAYPAPEPGSAAAWQVRVIDNLFPAFVPAGADANERTALGRHEVIVECPDHRRQFTELSAAEAELVLRVYRDRLHAARLEQRETFALIFKNSGRDAGMSREHLHSQLIGLPQVPPRMQSELDGASAFWNAQQTCVFCQLSTEAQSSQRLVLSSPSVIAFCPYASRLPYEVWILPREHAASFELARDSLLREVADVLHCVLTGLQTRLGQVAYNYLIHSSPFDTCHQDHYHWHIEILPRTGHQAGWEWGSGVLINTVSPEVAAQELALAVPALHRRL
jgi:UDPglucose--hexose-1-phosphate uridylyltransferase